MTVDPPEVPMTDLATKSGAQQAADEPIDEELLAEAQRQLGLSSPNAAINEMLRTGVEAARQRRRDAYDNLQRMVAEGGMDFAAIDDIDR
jgi:hypothetical protein